jgi:hypothetical protein
MEMACQCHAMACFHDVGVSLHISQLSSQPHQRMHSRLKTGANLIFSFEFEFNLMFRPLSCGAVLCTQAVDR